MGILCQIEGFQLLLSLLSSNIIIIINQINQKCQLSTTCLPIRQGDTPEKFKDRMAKMNINLGAWRRDEKVIGWLVQKSRDYLADPTVLNALDAL